MPPEGTDRRRHVRIDVMAQVHIKRGQTSLVLEVLNVSESGAFVDLGGIKRPAWAAAGKNVDLILFLVDGDADAPSIRTAATIVRVIETAEAIGFAVEFCEDVSALARELVHAATPRPPPLPPKLPRKPPPKA